MRQRLRAVLLGAGKPEEDQAVLAGLVVAAGLLNTVVDKPEHAQAKRRAEELRSTGDELADAARQAIKAAQDAVIAATLAASVAATSAATAATST